MSSFNEMEKNIQTIIAAQKDEKIKEVLREFIKNTPHYTQETNDYSDVIHAILYAIDEMPLCNMRSCDILAFIDLFKIAAFHTVFFSEKYAEVTKFLHDSIKNITGYKRRLVDTKVEDLNGITTRIAGALSRQGIVYISQLHHMKITQIARIRTLGKKSLQTLLKCIDEYNETCEPGYKIMIINDI